MRLSFRLWAIVGTAGLLARQAVSGLLSRFSLNYVGGVKLGAGASAALDVAVASLRQHAGEQHQFSLHQHVRGERGFGVQGVGMFPHPKPVCDRVPQGPAINEPYLQELLLAVSKHLPFWL